MKNITDRVIAVFNVIFLYLLFSYSRQGDIKNYNFFVCVLMCSIVGWGIYLSKILFRLQKRSIIIIIFIVLIYFLAIWPYVSRSTIFENIYMDMIFSIMSWMVMAFLLHKTSTNRKILLWSIIPSGVLVFWPISSVVFTIVMINKLY